MTTTGCTFTTRRTREANVITAALAVPCALAAVSTVVPAVEQTVTAVLLGVALLAALVLAVRLGARWLRERREDRADAVTAARWRAHHAPHLLDAADHAALTRASGPARIRTGVA